MIEAYYDQLARYYRYLFPDWEASVTRQARVFDELIQDTFDPHARRVLDAACGIGTQCIGLAELGYQVTASDISMAAIELARQEAIRRSLSLTFIQADMRTLRQAHSGMFDLVIACDNAIPHLLSQADILKAFQQFYACTTPEGGCLISVRDYAAMELGGKRMYPRTVHQTPEGRGMLFDLWEFEGEYYDFTTYFVLDQGEAGVQTQAIRGGRYYCVSLATLEGLLLEAGFSRVAIEREKFYQPVLMGCKRA
jgi:SAM-dependent methyltransferase